MSPESPQLRWPVVVAAALGLLLTGAGVTYLWMRPPSTPPAASGGSAPSTTSPAASEPGQSVEPVVTLTPEVIARAGIIVAAVQTGTVPSTMRLPAIVEPNAYRQVAVTPLVAGKVTRVDVELGDQVRRGQRLAEVFSPELAEAQARYTSLGAELLAAQQELDRTERLAKIGAASQQELERARATHAVKVAAVADARSKLTLFGVETDTSAEGGRRAMNASIDVLAPIDGTVTARAANPGLNVEASTPLFTVVDLSTVWVVSDVQEKDLARIRVGSPVLLTTSAQADPPRRGRVSYLDPQINPDTRTARARVEIANPGHALRLGMYAEMIVEGAARAGVSTIPASAVQTVGQRQVVYVVDPGDRQRFTEREIQVGDRAGDQVEVLSGLQPGDLVVTAGSFFVRAERERVAPRREPPSAQTIRVLVTEQGFEPSRIDVRGGTPVRLLFTRTTDKTCATQVTVPSLGIKRDLPLNQTVVVELRPDIGEVAFVCGMNMLKGVVVVKR